MIIEEPTRLVTSYTLLIYLHVSCVVLSGAGFVLRGIWMLHGSPMLARRWVRIAPHALDTVLLASAIALTLMIGQYPLLHGWLTAKVLGLIAYIVLGTIALKRGRSLGIRFVAFCGALVVFAYIVAVAMTKSVLPFGS
jgi:uncharacterized membrane protein SirB2